MVKIVGILNITPDSFSDAGKYIQAPTALEHTKYMIKAGANIIDIGAESTRPGATIINSDDELLRLEPVLSAVVTIAHDYNVQVSIDTYKPTIASFAIDCGVDFINDVTGFSNPKMINIAKQHHYIKLIAMHSLGVPANRNVHIPEDVDAVTHILEWGKLLINKLEDEGIKRSNIIIDPGVGFGKTAEQSWHIINNIEKLHELGVEIYVGHSRKGFLNLDNNNKDAYTLAVSSLLALHKVNYLRVHNVGLHSKLFAKIC